jgi:hypothetical protein
MAIANSIVFLIFVCFMCLFLFFQEISGLQIDSPFFKHLLHVVGQFGGEHHLFACGGMHEA